MGARRTGKDDRDVRQAILCATRNLLAERQFGDISVADILTEAGVSRGTFYFYFADKNELLAELVRVVVSKGHEAAEPWLGEESDDETTLRHGITEGALLWQREAPILRAIVENFRADPALSDLWLSQMRSYTEATAARIHPTGDVDPAALAAALTWLGERLYYLAAIGEPPFDDPDTLIRTLLHIWTRVTAE